EFTAAADAPPITMGPGGLPANRVMSGGIAGSSRRIEIERRAREPRPDGIDELRGKDVGFLGTIDLAAKERNRPKKWVRERRNVVPVVHSSRGSERVFVGNVHIESRRAEVFSNRLHGIVEVLSDSGGHAVRHDFRSV